MSGVEGIAIGAIGLTALFTTCVDAFNIVVTARDFDQDFEVLCADLSLQRLRFCLWGEAIGLVSRESTQSRGSLAGLHDPHVQSTLTATLQAVQYLLQESDRMREDFLPRPRSSRGLGLFRSTFDEFRRRVDRNRKQSSVARVTKWAIYARDRFQDRLERLKSLIDGLENVSESLNVLNVQRSRMEIEIESLDDTESLRLLREASAHSQPDLSHTASNRLLSLDAAVTTDNVSASTYTQSFHTAEETHDRVESAHTRISLGSEGMPLPLLQLDISQNTRIMAGVARDTGHFRKWVAGPKTDRYGAILKQFDLYKMASLGEFPTSLLDVRESLMEFAKGSPLWEKVPHAKAPKQRFSCDSCRDHKITPKFMVRMAKEIIMPHPSWIAYAPVDFEMNHLLAGIEGPQDTPYEGGVFWITIHFHLNNPIGKPPIVRFLTRIYHPNIDSRGQVCLDILEPREWSGVITLPALMISICSMLADPGLTDPLVPEIAEIYCKDFDLFSHNARTYTTRYAVAQPDLNDGQLSSPQLQGESASPSALPSNPT
ncbi:MAG: hypothetical protein Q9213_008147 [Squamulea squamosa]